VINVEQDGDEDDEEVEENGRKRKLKSAVWSEFKRVKVGDVWKAKCNYCSKKLSGVTKNGTSGRVLSDHRSRLTPKTLEVLMCAQNWLRVGQAKGKEDYMGLWTCLEDIQEELVELSFGFSTMPNEDI